MPDLMGNIPVPEITPSGVFPIVSDYPHGRAHRPEVIVHQFGSANAKIEQRFLLGNGAKRFTARKAYLREADRIALRDFWESHYGPYGAFTYNAPNDDGNGTTPYTCRFANEPLSWEMISDAVSSVGVTLIEIPATSPTYPLNQTVTRFPTTALASALLSQVQQVIPLIKIQPAQAGYSAIYVSDRRCMVGGQLYQARLLDVDGISQSIGNEADEARFTFGNADRVMRDLANDVDLFRASIEFSLFHVGTGIKLDLWKGDIVNWSMDSGPEFQVTAADGIYELNLPYPTRRISRTCWKQFNDGLGCPFASQGALDLVHFPDADPTKCDKGYETPNGCLAHGMKRFFGGILAEPQAVRIKDNSTGTWGFGRSTVTSVSLVADSIYDEVLPEIYTDSDMPVNCKIAAGRDESDFYNALGIVGEGPLGAYGVGHKLDGQFHHGYPGPLGLRQVLGNDPAGLNDFFSLSQSGNVTGGDWRKVFAGASTYKDNFAAGTAFLELKRSDPKGIQLTRLGEHQMQAIVAQGLSGWVWTSPGIRSQQVITNPIWIVINMLLRARGLRFADTATAEQYFDLDAAIAAASICDDTVDKLVGSGTEMQFKFRGVLQEEKPLRDWIQEVLMNCFGYYSFAFGKLKLGVRVNSSVVEAFTEGNILFQSLQLAPLKPSFNHLTANFADEEFEFVTNSITVYDIDHAGLIGGASSPLFLKSNVNLSGSSSKSHAARIVSVRLREELGGITAEQWKRARQISLRTTVLALNTEPGMVCSMTHPDMPDGVLNGNPTPNYGEFRVTGWRLNKDYSIDIQGRTTTDDMYNLVAGPKPADVPADPVPVELIPTPSGLVWHPDAVYPDAADPMFDENDGSFSLAQEYTTLADGSSQAELAVSGKLPVNDFIPFTKPPAIRSVTSDSTGGLLAGDRNYFLAISAKDASGKFSPPSNIVSIHVPAGTNTNKITLDSIEWPVGTFDGYVVFAAADDGRMMCRQAEGTGTPTSIEIPGPFARSTWNLPSPNFNRLRVKAKQVIHAGVVGASVSDVATGKISAADTVGGDDWTGRDISIIADRTDGSAPIWNFRVTAFNGASGEFTVTPDPLAAGVEPGDALIIRAQPPGVYPADSISDAKFQNAIYPAGMTPDVEIGNLVRVISGTGRGQVRRIVDNDATTLWIDTPWDVPPDVNSRFIVEAPAWQYFAESNPTRNSDRTLETTIRVFVENLFEQQLLVQAVAVDVLGVESPDSLSPIREIYVYGSLQSLVTEGIQNYVIEGGLSTKPASDLTMDSPDTVAFVNGSQVTVPAQSYTYPANKFISDEINPDGQLVHLAYDNYINIPSIPESGGLRVQMVQTSATNIIGVFDRRVLEPLNKQLLEAGFQWKKILEELEIGDDDYPAGTQVKKYNGAFRYAANNGILWYFSNVGLYHLVEKIPDKIKTYLNVYIANLTNSYYAVDVFADSNAKLDVNTTTGAPDPPRPPDSHDSYAATFLMLAVRYLRATQDWAWLDEVNTRFNESNLQTLLSVATYNLTTQVKTEAWCTTHGFPVNYPNGHNTLLVSTFQNGFRAEDSLTYDFSFTADIAEVYRGLKDLGDLLEDLGDANATNILQFAANIGVALHGLYDVRTDQRKWVWNDTLIQWQPSNTWTADASSVGTALYPDLFAQVFAELWQVPSSGGEILDGTRFNDGWEQLNLGAPFWWERTEYDSFPNLFYGWMALVRRKDPERALKNLKKFFKYYLSDPKSPGSPPTGTGLSGPTSGLALISEVGFAVGIMDVLAPNLLTEREAIHPYATVQVKEVRAAKSVSPPSRVQSLAAPDAVHPNASLKLLSATADVTLASTPSIEAGRDGQIITLINIGENLIELRDQSALADSGLILGQNTVRLEQWNSVSLVYLTAVGGWVKIDNTQITAFEAEYFKATGYPGPASDAAAAYLAARALRFRQISSDEDPLTPDQGDAGAILYAAPGGLEFHGRRTANGLLVSLYDILLVAADLMVNAPGLDPNFRFRVDGDAQKAAALINGFLKIADRLTINGDADASYRLKVNGDSYLNGLVKLLSTVVLDALTGGKALFLSANKEVYSADIDLAAAYITGTLQAWKVDLSNYYTKGEIDNLLIGKAHSNHIHAFSVYSASAGDPPHQHLVGGTTGIEQ